jgi:ribosome biogenesis protein SSF1/2
MAAVKLTEIGPRMRLCLIKVEEGFCSGEVLYHKHVTKTPEEVAALRAETHR